MCVNSWGNLRLWQQRGGIAAAANGRCLVTTDFRSCGTFREAAQLRLRHLQRQRQRQCAGPIPRLGPRLQVSEKPLTIISNEINWPISKQLCEEEHASVCECVRQQHSQLGKKSLHRKFNKLRSLSLSLTVFPTNQPQHSTTSIYMVLSVWPVQTMLKVRDILRYIR